MQNFWLLCKVEGDKKLYFHGETGDWCEDWRQAQILTEQDVDRLAYIKLTSKNLHLIECIAQERW